MATGRRLAFGTLALVAVLMAGLVIWRVADPRSTAGSAVVAADRSGAATSARPSDPTSAATRTSDSSPESTSAESSSPESTSAESSSTDSEAVSSVEKTTSAAPSTSAPEVAAPSQLRIGVSYLPSTTDPATDSSGATAVWNQVFDTLTTYRGSSAVAVGDLAQSWKPNADSTSWTFRIVAGKKFHDGAPVTAAAVCDNFNFWNSRKGSAQEQYFDWLYYFGGFAGQPGALLTSCRAVGDGAVLALRKPTPALADIVSQSAFAIHSPKSLTGTQPVGSGPYEWSSGTASKVMLQAVDPAAPIPGTLEFDGIFDAQTMVQAVKGGQLQLAYLSGARPASTTDMTVKPELTDQMVSLNLYGGHGPLADGNVRAAIFAAVDRAAVASALGLSPAQSVLPGVFAGRQASIPAANTALAKKLLAGKKVTLTMAVRRFGAPNSAVQDSVIAVALGQAGIVVSKKDYTSVSSYYSDIQKGKVDLSIGRNLANMADLGDFVSIYTATGGYGQVLPMDAKVALARQIDQALRLTSNQARQAACAAVLTELLKRKAVLPLYSIGGQWLIGDGVSGFAPAPFHLERLDSVRVK